MATDASGGRGGLIARHLVQVFLFGLLQVVLLWLIAGRAYAGLWRYAAFYLGGSALSTIVLLRTSPALVAERAAHGPGTMRWDPPLAATVALFGPLLMIVVAGLDVRLAWAPIPGPGWLGAGLIAAFAGYALTLWAMVVNRFFSGVVRIQTERDHQAITTGPYRWVRHPGYVGVILFNIGAPLILGSWCALGPGLLVVAVTILRTALEDGVLRAGLAGYETYAARVRYRLFPGVW